MNDLLAIIRRLVSGEHPSSEMSDWLATQRCDYWLSKLPSSNTKTMLNKICVQTRYNICRPLFESFNAHGIPYAVVKGAALSQAIYNDPYIRQSGDIDLLIDRGQIDNVKTIMREHDFIQGRVTQNGVIPYSREDILFHATATHQTAPFIKASGHPLCPYVNVDVNLDIMWGESAHKVDVRRVLSHTETTSICDIPISVLSAEAAFIVLGLHHYKDMNSPYLLSSGSLRLGLFCDIYYYIQRATMNFQKLRELCIELQILPYIYYIVHYTHELFHDRESAALRDMLYTQDVEPIMHCFGLTESSRHLWKIDFTSRLLCDDITPYLEQELTEQELASIHANRQHM